MPGPRVVRGPHREVAGILRCFPGNGRCSLCHDRPELGTETRTNVASDSGDQRGADLRWGVGFCTASRCQRVVQRSGDTLRPPFAHTLVRKRKSPHGTHPASQETWSSPSLDQSLDRVFVERHVQIGAWHPPCGALTRGQTVTVRSAVTALGACAGVHNASCGTPSPFRTGSQPEPGSASVFGEWQGDFLPHARVSEPVAPC